MDNKIKFGYWGVRGAGQVSRHLLAYTGAQWEDVKYVTRQAWFDKDKQELGLVFPNLPYLIDGDFKLTESRAINLYIIKKAGKNQLLGKTLQDEARVESVIGVYSDVRTALAPLIFDPEWQNKVSAVVDKVKPKLEEFAKFIGDKSFALGYLTLADFYLAEFSHYVQKVTPDLYAQYPYLGNIRKAVDELPEIKAYYETETAVKGPFFPPYAAIKF